MNQLATSAIALCPGFHPPDLTQSFCQHLDGLGLPTQKHLVFPSDRAAPYDSLAVLRFLHEHLSRDHPQDWLTTPITLIGFSAGAVAAMGAALMLEGLGGTVQTVFLLDGWGVPIAGHFPTHRLSHDRFTHWSSTLLGAGQDSFYAEPAVDHLALWRSPHIVQGFWVKPMPTRPSPTTALDFLAHWLQYYQEKT